MRTIGCHGVALSDASLARLVAALHSLHIERPTAIQAACIGPALAGRDIIGCGETGAGKTLAFGLPVVQLLSEDMFGIAALILTPSRELAVQVGKKTGGKFSESVVADHRAADGCGSSAEAAGGDCDWRNGPSCSKQRQNSPFFPPPFSGFSD